MRRLRRIKILATLGPASSDSAMIRRLFEAGADVFRINMSHTSHDKMRELVKTIRNVESSYGRPIGILVEDRTALTRGPQPTPTQRWLVATGSKPWSWDTQTSLCQKNGFRVRSKSEAIGRASVCQRWLDSP